MKRFCRSFTRLGGVVWVVFFRAWHLDLSDLSDLSIPYTSAVRRKSRKEAFASDVPPSVSSPNVVVSGSSGSSGVRNVASTERNDVMASKTDANSSSSDCVWGGDVGAAETEYG